MVKKPIFDPLSSIRVRSVFHPWLNLEGIFGGAYGMSFFNSASISAVWMLRLSTLPS